MIGVLIAVGVKAAQGREEHLPLDPDLIANRDHLRGHLELLRKVSRGKYRRQRWRGQQGTRQCLFGVDGAGHLVVPSGVDQVAALLGKNRPQCGGDLIAAAGLITVQADGSAGIDLILHDALADLQYVSTAYGNRQRNLCIAVQGLQQIRRPAAPARQLCRDAAGLQRLPLFLLLVVGEQIRRQGHRFVLELRAGGRHHQRTDIANHTQLALLEQCLHFRHVRGHAQIGGLRRDGAQRQ